MLRATNFSLFFCVLLSASVFSQNSHGVRQAAVEGASVAYLHDAGSIIDNPALLSAAVHPQVIFHFSPAPFGLTELKTASASAIVLISREFASISVSGYGFDLYHSFDCNIAYAKSWNEQVSTGISLHSHTVSIKNYGTATSFYPSAGLLYRFSDALSYGFALQNFTASRIGESKTPLPIIYTTGFTFHEDNAHFHLALEKETRTRASVKIGSNYHLTSNVELLIGYNTYPVQGSFGIAITVEKLAFLYSVSDNQDLGYTHQVGLSYAY